MTTHELSLTCRPFPSLFRVRVVYVYRPASAGIPGKMRSVILTNYVMYNFDNATTATFEREQRSSRKLDIKLNNNSCFRSLGQLIPP